MLLITQGTKNHYVYIRDLSNLLGKMGSTAKHFCFKCLKGFGSVEIRDTHQINCGNKVTTQVEMPIDGETLIFTKQYAMMKSPFVIYADLEAFPKKVKIDPSTGFTKNQSSTTLVNIHEPTTALIATAL